MHVYRERNKVADALAAEGHGKSFTARRYTCGDFQYFRVWSDGSCRQGNYAFGVFVEGATANPGNDDAWVAVADASGSVSVSTVAMAEFTGLLAACILLCSLMSDSSLTLPLHSLDESVHNLRTVAGF